MKIIHDLAQLDAKLRGGAVSIGNFDGVHRGHARIVERLKRLAAQVGGPSIVFTFDPHPVRLLRPTAAPPPLTWTDRKAELLAALGVDALVVYPTDEALLRLSADDFFRRIVEQSLGARGIVEGPNFYFGRGRSGDIATLGELTAAADMSLEVVEPLQIGAAYVSSSRVRDLIAAGAVGEARALLTAPYRVRGMVVHGAGRGAKIGFGTANLDAIDTLLPGAGVYAGRAFIAGEPWPAAINIGPNLTFGEQRLKVEAHIVGWREPLYHQPLEVDFLARLRDIQRFDGVDALVRQLHADVAATRAAFAAEATRA